MGTVHDRGVVREVAAEINIPFTVGGGISAVEDIGALLDSGADKVSINTAAVKDPDVIARAATNFGSQCIVLAIDAKETVGGWKVFLNISASSSESVQLVFSFRSVFTFS